MLSQWKTMHLSEPGRRLPGTEVVGSLRLGTLTVAPRVLWMCLCGSPSGGVKNEWELALSQPLNDWGDTHVLASGRGLSICNMAGGEGR